MSLTTYEQYRPPGRSARSGRSQADNDVFEGLPVKQWGQQLSRISLAPPQSETGADSKQDKWGEPPMPRDSQLLQPWTQQLLRLARSGKVGAGRNKRKVAPTADVGMDGLTDDDGRGEEEGEVGEEKKSQMEEERGYVARKWKPVPEALLEPEHKHFAVLAKRRKGLPSLYGPGELSSAAVVPMRKTKVRKTGPEGESVIYEVLVPEGQTVEGEVMESSTELADINPITNIAPGTIIEGVGIANADGVVVAEHLKPSAANPRRNRPPPKKKGGPGRGKKRVTFTNPDGSTYTTIVPNATKIVPLAGQVVKHVAKDEKAGPDVQVAQVAKETVAEGQVEGEGEGEVEVDGEAEREGEGEEDGSDDGEEGDENDDDDEREEGELSDEDAPTAPAPPDKIATQEPTEKPSSTETKDVSAPSVRDASSSPELPLAKTSHSRHASLAENAALQSESTTEAADMPAEEAMDGEDDGDGEDGTEKFEDGEEDLLGNLMKDLEGDDPDA